MSGTEPTNWAQRECRTVARELGIDLEWCRLDQDPKEKRTADQTDLDRREYSVWVRLDGRNHRIGALDDTDVCKCEEGDERMRGAVRNELRRMLEALAGKK